jgi:hypothetical protein
MRCADKVCSMILLHDLPYYIRLDHIEVMFVQVFCRLQFQHGSISCIKGVTEKRGVWSYLTLYKQLSAFIENNLH